MGGHGALLPAGSVGIFSCVSEFSTGLLKCSAFNLVTVFLTKYWCAISKPGFVPVVESLGANYMSKVVTFPAWSWLDLGDHVFSSLRNSGKHERLVLRDKIVSVLSPRGWQQTGS